MTRAPSAFASWTAAVPTPLPAAHTRTSSPARTRARVTSIRQAVRKTRGKAAASSKPNPSGSGITLAAGQRTLLRVASVDLVAEDAVGAAEAVLAAQAHPAAAAGHAGGEHDALADAEAVHGAAQGGDLPRDVAPQHVRERHLQAGQPRARPEVQVVQGAGPHAHHDLAGPGDRLGEIRGLRTSGPP